ncbi:MAG: hypothetical protein HPY69_09015 [Armatimonadetes bacterium]|nr:hypothetical protein [Armatimonadota bacterium]
MRLTALTLPMLAAAAEVQVMGMVPGAKPFTIVAFGDSTTAPRGELTVYPMLLERALAAVTPPIKIINSGAPSDSTREARARFSADVLAHAPDLVIMQFGINDAAIDVWRGARRPRIGLTDYAANLAAMVRELRRRRVGIILMTPNPLRWTPELRAMYGQPPYNPDHPDGLNGLLPRYAQKVRDIAGRYDVPLVDSFTAFREYGEVPGQSVDDLLLDGMHPNEQGHALEARLLLPHVRAALGQRPD